MRIIFIILLFLISANAFSIKHEILKEGYILRDSIEYKLDERFNYKNELFKDFSVKLILNKNYDKQTTYYVKVSCDVDNIISSNVKYKTNFDSLVFKINKDTPKEIYFTFSNKEAELLHFRTFFLNEFEYKYILKREGILFGLSYGLIFCAFLYNFVLFLYTFEKSFLYYSFMQASLGIVLYNIYLITFVNYMTRTHQIVLDIFEDFVIIFIILFSLEILNIKKDMKIFHKIFAFIIYLNIIDIIFTIVTGKSILYEYLPRTLILILLLIAGVISYFQGNKSSKYYIFGWAVLLASLFLAEGKIFELHDLYVIHIGFPLESLILSFALGYSLKQNIKQREQKEKLLVHQSKLASMGEMINNIAHQWRQPLTHLSLINMNLSLASSQKDLKETYLNEMLEESNVQIDFMSKTIDSFKDFYKPAKKKEFFKVSLAVQNAIDIIKQSFESAGIKIDFDIQEDKELHSHKNEYSQVVLNLLTNAKDALFQRKINNAQVLIKLYVHNNKSVLVLCDNAKGINEKHIGKIFDPYFTTKVKGSGIGLYMSKIIINRHLKGEISVENNLDGACFTLKV